jgi:hypothetical protein
MRPDPITLFATARFADFRVMNAGVALMFAKSMLSPCLPVWDGSNTPPAASKGTSGDSMPSAPAKLSPARDARLPGKRMVRLELRRQRLGPRISAWPRAMSALVSIEGKCFGQQ